jgi:hypothetical protein
MVLIVAADRVSDKPPQRPGGVVRWEAEPATERPVRLELYDHPHRYEVAWREEGGAPVLTDLRVMAPEGAPPITKSSLRRIDPDRLARFAAARSAELGFLGSVQNDLREANGTGDLQLSQLVEPGGITVARSKRARGRPKFTREELEQIASWARDSAREAEAERRPAYPLIAARAVASGWRGYTAKHPPTTETVKGWIRRCKEAGVLAPDWIRGPRRTKEG